MTQLAEQEKLVSLTNASCHFKVAGTRSKLRMTKDDAQFKVSGASSVSNATKSGTQKGTVLEVRRRVLKAVDDVTLDVFKNETLGLVGESGCGKTTLGRLMCRIYPLTGGSYLYEGSDVAKLNKRESLDFCKKVQMIFQDPYASLNPRMTIGTIISEGMDIHKLYTPDQRQQRVFELLEKVGLNREQASRFPHEFSGGQRQRIVIARALAIEPKFIICDEPISALDVSIQSQVINLLTELKRELGLTYVFISHDLNVVKYISDRVAVMYLGAITELADNEKIYANPLHPYTKALLSAVPVPDPDKEKERQRVILQGDVPSPIDTPPGCSFCSRCPNVMDVCSREKPMLKDIEPGHKVACHLY